MNDAQNILRLDDQQSSNVSLSGGKGASLSKLRIAGIPVPPGFVISVHAYKNGMTPDLEKEILAAFDALKVPRVAVRSSALAEDSDTASWAGQLESYLNTTKSELIEAVKKCWDSVSTERAKEYADKHNVNDDQRAVAVVVQAMVDSEISGVLFTANPVTQNRNEVMVEAICGLGEMLVQGLVTPESFITDKDGNVLSHDASGQRKQLVYKDGQNQELSMEPKPRTLSDELLGELVQLSQRIETYYNGAPQDIEWAASKGKLFIVQSRPITTL